MTDRPSASSHHHLIARFHLNQWSNNGSIAVYRKRQDLLIPAQPVSHTSVRRNYHTVRAGIVVSDAIERAMADRVESPASPILKSLRVAPLGPLAISDVERQALSRYLGVQYARVEGVRSLVEDLMREMVANPSWKGVSTAQMAQFAEAAAIDGNAEEVSAWREVLSYAEEGKSTGAVVPQSSLQAIAMGATTLAGEIARKPWTVFRRSGPPYFSLGDRPVMVVGTLTGDQTRGGKWFSVALGPDTLLMGLDDSPLPDRVVMGNLSYPFLKELWRQSLPTSPEVQDPFAWYCRQAWHWAQWELYGNSLQDLMALRRLMGVAGMPRVASTRRRATR